MIYTVDTPAAALHVERTGEGPAIVLIPGGGGDAAMYTALIDELARKHTVITYDRRGNSRSSLKPGAGASLPDQAADVVAILDDAGFDQAFVFGSSAGALVTLSLLTSYADRVAAAVVHEPPVIQVLPDAAERTAYFDDLGRIAEREGALPAMMKFATSTMDRPTKFFDSRFGRTIGAAAVGLASRVTPKNEMNRLFGNADQLMRTEMPDFTRYQPDREALRNANSRWAFGVGALSEGRYYSRPARQLSAELGVPCLEFPGGHLGYQSEAAEFARRLQEFFDA
ncbi:alpha/beta hydrolase [Kribbella kalugense]|uniref:Pimeloyl-ACP methyl ester carboxylesterase n=1 Tax=Kribbella kalugense TaxID=2512221 RepID=A0A4R7ZHM7_9ACTN|nr:alpha/beta hydrolase [Kribbella kalugense]TDW15828.1 pimeloyl-ACP methyl ester carboxylesterase [Kribbella kalugense]